MLCYMPNPVQDRSVDIGVAVLAIGEEDFGEVRFLKTWGPVLRLDPNADVDVLDAFVMDVKEQFRVRESRDRIVKLMKDSFSNVIRLSTIQQCTSIDPLCLLEQLSRKHLSAT